MVIMARLSKRKLPNGVLPAARKFDVPHSTVRVNIKNYKEAKFENEEHRKRPRKNRGAKTLLPSKLDGKVLQMKKKYEASRVCPQLQLVKRKWWKFKYILWCQTIFPKNWLYQKTSSNSETAYVSKFLERDGFLLSLGY